ncbi:hypothetical protein [Helicobacter sp. MIT 14-3879]|uniref:hypothetical protein n=1 Tax=Helicobacter sp. MIT 14-3879 TaxID=2040649 RepID=UPI000E1EC95D|nr:hypothetical protein [Helicobacter sp. MIT 14-3879]RDU61846.1 hypothetical protein CQA44_07925 [Helicobacter sp. MIT 14-3879]
MIDITGAKVITLASIFGGAAVIFTIAPFLFVIIHGIIRSNQQTTGGQTTLSIILKALIVHLVSCVAFIATIYSLDRLDPNNTQLFTKKIFEVFWAGNNQGEVFNLVGGSNSVEMMSAYVVLHLLSVIVHLAYAISPIAIFILAVVYGVGLAKKDTYKDSYSGIVSWSIISVVFCSMLYITWAYLASPALFLPSGNLFDKISNFYKEILI